MKPAQAIVQTLLENDDDFTVHVPPGGRVVRHDDAGFEIEYVHDPNTGKWFEDRATGSLIFVKAHLNGGRYTTLMFSPDLSVGPIKLDQRFSRSWIPTQKPAGVDRLMTENGHAIVQRLLEAAPAPRLKPLDQIKAMYGSLDRGAVTAQAAEVRVGTAHDEYTFLCGGGQLRSYCTVCGYVDKGRPNPVFHPERYLQ